MSGVQIKIDVDEAAARASMKAVEGNLIDRRVMNEMVSLREEHEVREWLRLLAGTKHTSADRLGATPTDHFGRAAESVASTFDENGSSVTVTSPGIGRAFHDITIVPGPGKKYLTIPATAAAYGKRAGAFNDLRLAFFGRGVLALIKAEQSSLADRKESGGRTEVFYWLKKQIKQPQDRTLLPSDKQLTDAAEEGVVDYLKLLASTAR